MKPLVAVYFTDPEPMGAPFNKQNGSYMRGYLELAREIADLGGRCCFVRGSDTFVGAGTFTRCFWPEDGNIREEQGPIQADIVLNKGEDQEFDDGTKVVNDPQFHAFCNDKPATYRTFKDVSPVSIVVRTKLQLENAVKRVPGEKIVAKPVAGAGSRGVVIGSREEVLAAEHTYPIVVQEWIDTSAGIPGICEGRHDLRFIIIAGILALVAVKSPEPGKLVYGLSQGGSFRILDDGEVPLDAWEMVEAIDGRLDHFPSRYYSIDVARRADGKWFLIELNSPAGMNEEAEHDGVHREHELLARLLLREAQRE